MSLEEQEVDRLLEREPANIEALVRKGELRTQAGDDRAGAAFYQAALNAAAAATPLPMRLKPAIERAQAGLAGSERNFGRSLEDSLARSGFPASRRPPRFQESLDIMSGRRSVSLQLQQPTSYYFPGLPQRSYYERSEFAWAGQLEVAVPGIRDEILAYLSTGQDGFTPYVVDDPTRPRRDFHGLANNKAWSTLYLWEKGAAVESLLEIFPRTFAAMRELDLARIGKRAPSLLFSRLLPGARIPAHHGMLNARLICHLPLIVPPGCGFRVGSETRKWTEGELLIFDDTVEHEAWNEGSSDRIIFIFDIWRPELSEEERRAVVAMFEAVDSYNR